MGVDVTGDVHYFISTTDGCPPCVVPYSIATAHRSNLEHVSVRMPIHDLRSNEKTVDLDKNGFGVLQYEGGVQEEFESGSEAQKTYYEEISEILKQHLGASKVIVYNFAFRSRGLLKADEKHDDNHREPACYPHVDIAASAVQGLAEILLGKEEGERAMQNRIQVMNVWRPLGSNPITRQPLTICDYQSIQADKDLHPYTVRGAKLHSAGYLMSRDAQDAHRWYYLSHMRSDEMFAFKMADTKPDVARVACHTAFINENEAAPDAEQTSLEVRCLILYDESS